MLDRTAIDVADLLAELATLRSEVAELRTLRPRLEALERAQQPGSCEDAISTMQAMGLTGRSRQCVVNWCERYNIGWFGGERPRWIISRSKLIEFCRSHRDASRHTFW